MKVGETRENLGPRAKEIVELTSRYESGGGLYNNYLRTGWHAPVIAETRGTQLVDVDGNEYLDLSGGFCAAVQGYQPEAIKEAVVEQLNHRWFLPEMPSPERAQLAKELVEVAPGSLKEGRVQFELSGAGAVDLALQLAQFYGATNRQREGVGKILAFVGAYHGRTTLTSSAGSLPAFRRRLPAHDNVVRMPYPYCYRCPYGETYPDCGIKCAEEVASLLASAGRDDAERPTWLSHGPDGEHVERNDDPGEITTMVVEPLQDYAGMIIPPKEFHPRLREICDEYGLTFVDDEVPCFLHTGRWFGIEHWDVEPDVIAIGKALSGGAAPVSAVIARPEIFEAWGDEPGRHFTTYMGYPLGSAAALANIQSVKRDGVLKTVEEVGAYFKAGLDDLQSRHELIGEVSALGGLLGMELVRDRKTKEPAVAERNAFARAAMQEGVIVPDAMGDSPRCLFIPPAVMTRAEIDLSMEVMDRALGAAASATHR
jgi:4-aminobutyrate aminotransferase-like enzyme